MQSEGSTPITGLPAVRQVHGLSEQPQGGQATLHTRGSILNREAQPRHVGQDKGKAKVPGPQN